MIHVSLLVLTLFGGVLVEPFRVAEAEPSHHQACLRAAMTPNGDFAIAWVDSTKIEDYLYEFELFIRFFDKDGNPKTEPYRIEKLEDTTCIYWPCLDMDTAGNAILLWIDNNNANLLRFQHFTPEGSPVDSAQTLRLVGLSGYRPCDLSLNNNGEFAAVWSGDIYVKVQRFDMEGNPKDSVFWVHDSSESWPPYFCVPGVALNDAGDLVVTWLEFAETMKNYPRFQMFDAQDESILPWEPMGHRLDDGGTGHNAIRSKPFWLDDDRFVAFWIDYPELFGRVFSNRGLTRHPMHVLLYFDSLASALPDIEGNFSVARSSNDSFAYTHSRTHYYPDVPLFTWEHGAGILGTVVDNEPWRRTTLFEYTPPWGADTVGKAFWGGQPPAVAVCNDRIVWVYTRFNTDTILEAFATISDWDMGVGIAEQPIVTHPSNWQITSSVGRQIVLQYSDSPQGFHASIFDASGRKVDELHLSQPSGVITWGECYGPGVYFIRDESDSPTTHKVILIQ